MIPEEVLADDEQIKGGPDSLVDVWSFKLLLDPTLDWTNSVFSVDSGGSLKDDSAFNVDMTHMTEEVPYILITLPPSAFSIENLYEFRWNLSERPVINRTFLKQTVKLVSR